MFPLNTILAWNINIIMNKKYEIITILLLPLGHISFMFAVCLRVTLKKVSDTYKGSVLRDFFGPNPHATVILRFWPIYGIC
jgi:hypothetical protein